MRNKQICDSCTFWKEIGLGQFGTCKIKVETTKWSATCREYIKFIKEPKNDK